MVAENDAPTTKKTDRPIRMLASPGSTNSSTNAITAKTASVLNWRVR